MLGGANITGNGGFTTYNGLQFEFRRRMSDGLQVSANYVYAISEDSTRYSFRVQRLTTRQTGAIGGVTHALKMNWDVRAAVGPGPQVHGATPNRFVDSLLGGWTFYGSGHFQSGRLLDFGNVRMVGMSEKEFLNAFQLRKTPDNAGSFASGCCRRTSSTIR